MTGETSSGLATCVFKANQRRVACKASAARLTLARSCQKVSQRERGMMERQCFSTKTSLQHTKSFEHVQCDNTGKISRGGMRTRPPTAGRTSRSFVRALER